MSDRRHVVRVSIVGEEYAIRSDATPEHTRLVAEYVDSAIRQVMNSGGVVEARKAAILAALQITDEFFKARQAGDRCEASMRGLSEEIRRMLPPAKRGEAR